MGLLYSDFFSNLPIGYQVSDVGLGFICDRSNCWLPGVCVLGGGAAGEETDRCRVNYIVIVLITLAKTTLRAQPSLPSTSDRPWGAFPSL